MSCFCINLYFKCGTDMALLCISFVIRMPDIILHISTMIEMYWQRTLRKTHHQRKKNKNSLSCGIAALFVFKFASSLWKQKRWNRGLTTTVYFIVAHKCHSLSWCGKQPWCSSPCTPALANHFSIPIICKSRLVGALLSSRRIKLICIYTSSVLHVANVRFVSVYET